jgi:hypothetical protein
MFHAAIGGVNHAFSSIADTGCSNTCSNEKLDFIPGTLKKLDQPISLGGIAGDLLIEYSGMVHWETVDAHGNILEFKTMAFYHPDLPGRLFSPQAYLREQSLLHDRHYKLEDHFSVYADRAEWHIDGQRVLTLNYDSSYLPRMILFHKGKAKTTLLGMQAVVSKSNANLTPLQRIWLRWHIKLGHLSFQHTLVLGMGGYLDRLCLGLGKRDKDRGTPKCASCQFGKQVRKADGATTTSKNPDVTGSLKEGLLTPGDRVFSDQLESRIRGRLLHTAGRELPSNQFCGSTIFVDGASGYIHVEHQVTLNASDTINAKNAFERKAQEFGVKVKGYHTDNGVYTSQAFTQELIDNQQTLRLSGVGAKWQNGVSEGAINLVVSRARTMMIHAALHWPEVEDESLWPLAINHAVYLYNNTPNVESGIAPIEVFGKTLSDHQALRNAHTWGAPLYTLQPRLQSAGGKIPKWQPRSRRGQYVGVSPLHAENVALVRNLRTGYLSPQYHVVFDDWFETVYADETAPDCWDELCMFERFETAFDGDPPRLGDEWLTAEEIELRKGKSSPSRKLYQDLQTREDVKDDLTYQPPKLPVTKEHHMALPREPPDAHPVSQTREPMSSTREPGSLMRQPEPVLHQPSPIQSQRSHSPSVPAPTRRNPTRTAKHKGVSRLQMHMDSRKSYEEADPVAAMYGRLKHKFGLASGLTPQAASLLASQALGFDHTTGFQEEHAHGLLQSPMALKGKAKDPDLPSTREALTGPHAEKFWTSMNSEIESLQAKSSWEIVERSSMPAGMKAVPGTWVHRVKRLPCGTLSKFKSRWCCRGDLMNIEGPTYSPLVGWPTVRAALLLAATHGWESRQVDFCNAFLQSDQPADQPLYLECPQYYRPVGCEDKDVVLRMKKSIYGQVNSPKLFYGHLGRGMEALGFKPTAADPCLFIHETLQIMVLNYCDDQIWLSPDNALIEEYVGKLKSMKYDLTLEPKGDKLEGTIFGFLGINFKCKNGTIELTQPGLINKVIKYTGMDDAKIKHTPAADAPLGSDKDGEPLDEEWSMPAAVGMLLYISSNTRPDIQFAVHQVARFTHSPKKSHGQALKRIIRYLIKTRDMGIRFVPDFKEGLNCYVDADFAGLYGYEDEQDPVCVKSRTGFTLTLFGCPIIWSSKLQTDICLSSTAAEYVAFSMAMRELLPMRALLKEISSKLNLTFVSDSLVRSTVFEDNQGCLSMVNVPKMSTRNKYSSLKYHFFRSHLGESKGIVARYISTHEHKADILTKGLTQGQFEIIRKLLIGW